MIAAAILLASIYDSPDIRFQSAVAESNYRASSTVGPVTPQFVYAPLLRFMVRELDWNKVYAILDTTSIDQGEFTSKMIHRRIPGLSEDDFQFWSTQPYHLYGATHGIHLLVHLPGKYRQSYCRILLEQEASGRWNAELIEALAIPQPDELWMLGDGVVQGDRMYFCGMADELSTARYGCFEVWERLDGHWTRLQQLTTEKEVEDPGSFTSLPNGSVDPTSVTVVNVTYPETIYAFHLGAHTFTRQKYVLNNGLYVAGNQSAIDTPLRSLDEMIAALLRGNTDLLKTYCLSSQVLQQFLSLHPLKDDNLIYPEDDDTPDYQEGGDQGALDWPEEGKRLVFRRVSGRFRLSKIESDKSG